MNSALAAVLSNPAIWRGRDCAPEPAALPSGFAALDAMLPGRGWPGNALTEIVLEREGIGEIRLTLPALARLQAQGRDIARQMGGQCPVSAEQSASAVEHRDRVGNRIEGLFPVALAAADEIMEPCVLDRDTDLSGDDPKQPLVCQFEPTRTLGRDRHRAEQLIAGENRDRQRTQRGKCLTLIARQERADVLDDERRARADHPLARRKSFVLEPCPQVAHRRRSDERLLDEQAVGLFP